MDEALLRRLASLASFDPVYSHVPMTLLDRLQQFLPDWDREILAQSWEGLVSQGLVKAMPLTIVNGYGTLTEPEDFVTEKGFRHLGHCTKVS